MKQREIKRLKNQIDRDELVARAECVKILSAFRNKLQATVDLLIQEQMKSRAGKK